MDGMMKIPEAARRDIFDAIEIAGISWCGRLAEVDFLGRIFDLGKLPSTDGRFRDAYGDIQQHRVNNYDWDDDWVFYDGRFNLLKGDDELFLKFLCEMVHPVVRADPEEADTLVAVINEALRKEGYELIERTRIAGRPVFAAGAYLVTPGNMLTSIREKFEEVNMDYVLRQITRMEAAIHEDPDLAIGTAKELVETCCKTILQERNIEFSDSLDLSQLVKLTAKELALTPSDIPDQAKAVKTIRRLLSNLASITQGMAELRNRYGTGHGKQATTKGLQSRHARLAVGAATTLAVFLIETDKARKMPSD